MESIGRQHPNMNELDGNFQNNNKHLNILSNAKTRFADSQQSFAVKLEKCRTTSLANTFVPMTSRNWNSLPASVFPDIYNLQSFKTRGHKHLRPPLFRLINFLFSLVIEGSFEIHRGCIYHHSISLKKKKKKKKKS